MSNILGTNVSSPIVPFTTNDEFPTHDAKYGKGGFRSVQTIGDRDNITSDRKDEGMFVYVVNEHKLYSWENNQWVEKSFGEENQINNIRINNHNLDEVSKSVDLVFSSTGDGSLTITDSNGSFSDTIPINTNTSGEENKIDYIKVNNNDLTPDSNKRLWLKFELDNNNDLVILDNNVNPARVLATIEIGDSINKLDRISINGTPYNIVDSNNELTTGITFSSTGDGHLIIEDSNNSFHTSDIQIFTPGPDNGIKGLKINNNQTQADNNNVLSLSFGIESNNLVIKDVNNNNSVLASISLGDYYNVIDGININNSNLLLDSNKYAKITFDVSNSNLVIKDVNNNNSTIASIPLGESNVIDGININNSNLDLDNNKYAKITFSSTGNGTLVITDRNANNGQGNIIDTINIGSSTTPGDANVLENVCVDSNPLRISNVNANSKAVNLDITTSSNGTFNVVDKNNNNTVVKTVNVCTPGDSNVLEHLIINEFPLSIDNITVGSTTYQKASKLILYSIARGWIDLWDEIVDYNNISQNRHLIGHIDVGSYMASITLESGKRDYMIYHKFNNNDLIVQVLDDNGWNIGCDIQRGGTSSNRFVRVLFSQKINFDARVIIIGQGYNMLEDYDSEFLSYTSLDQS